MTLDTILSVCGWALAFAATIAIVEVVALVVRDLVEGVARVEAEMGRRGDS